MCGIIQGMELDIPVLINVLPGMPDNNFASSVLENTATHNHTFSGGTDTEYRTITSTSIITKIS